MRTYFLVAGDGAEGEVSVEVDILAVAATSVVVDDECEVERYNAAEGVIVRKVDDGLANSDDDAKMTPR